MTKDLIFVILCILVIALIIDVIVLIVLFKRISFDSEVKSYERSCRRTLEQLTTHFHYHMNFSDYPHDSTEQIKRVKQRMQENIESEEKFVKFFPHVANEFTAGEIPRILTCLVISVPLSEMMMTRVFDYLPECEDAANDDSVIKVIIEEMRKNQNVPDHILMEWQMRGYIND